MMSLKYTVGDKVIVRNDLKANKIYGFCGCATGMEYLKGHIVTIEKIREGKYYKIKECGFWWTDEMFEGKVEDIFTKYDLKTGMLTTCRNGRKYLVLREISVKGKLYNIMVNNGGWLNFDSFSNDLLCNDVNDYDIVKVEEITSTFFSELLNVNKTYDRGFFTIVWKRNKEINLKIAIVKHDGVNKEYWFELPEKANVNKGDKVLVDTARGETTAVIKHIISFKMQEDLDEYIKVNNISGVKFPLRKVVGVINRF